MMNEGATLLHDIGVETKDLDPPLYGVPWTLFNGVSKKKRLSIWKTINDAKIVYIYKNYL